MTEIGNGDGELNSRFVNDTGELKWKIDRHFGQVKRGQGGKGLIY